MPVVRIPSVLRKHTDNQARVAADGVSVREVLHDIIARHPELGERLLDERGVRAFVNVYVRDEDIRYLDGLETPVGADDEVAIMPAVAGGART